MEFNDRKPSKIVRFLLYVLRWELSSPLLALCLFLLEPIGVFWATIVANALGACVFFIVDKHIFRGKW